MFESKTPYISYFQVPSPSNPAIRGRVFSVTGQKIIYFDYVQLMVERLTNGARFMVPAVLFRRSNEEF